MTALSLSNGKKLTTQLLIDLFDTITAIFGLKVVQRSKTGGFQIPLLQRILAPIWLAIFITNELAAEKLEYVAALGIKNSLIVLILPRISSKMSALSFLFTYILTHAFAKERKRLVEEVMKMYPHLNTKNTTKNLKGCNYIIVVGILQFGFSCYWHYTMSKLFTFTPWYTYLSLIVLTLPKLVCACFFVDYVTGICILLKQFNVLNGKLSEMRQKSLNIKHYPKNEQSFRKSLTEIVDQHKALCKITARMNDVYSFQLLLNIGVIYAYIVSRTYIVLYALLSSLAGHTNVSLAISSGLYLVFNALTLLVIVEITSQLYKEVNSG